MRARALQLVQGGAIRRARWRLVTCGIVAGVGIGILLAALVELGLALAAGAAFFAVRELRN